MIINMIIYIYYIKYIYIYIYQSIYLYIYSVYLKQSAKQHRFGINIMCVYVSY